MASAPAPSKAEAFPSSESWEASLKSVLAYVLEEEAASSYARQASTYASELSKKLYGDDDEHNPAEQTGSSSPVAAHTPLGQPLPPPPQQEQRRERQEKQARASMRGPAAPPTSPVPTVSKKHSRGARLCSVLSGSRSSQRSREMSAESVSLVAAPLPVPGVSSPRGVTFGDGRERLAERLKEVARFEFKLDAKEAGRLSELRALIAREQDGPATMWMKGTRQWELVRFLRGHEQNPKEALEFLKKTSAWRAEHRVPELAQRFLDAGMDEAASRKSPQFLRAYYPSRMIGTWQGRPVSLYRMGVVDFKGLLKESSVDAIVDLQVFQMDTLWRMHPQGDAILIIDVGYSEKEPNVPIQSVWDVQPWVNALLTVVKASGKVVDPAYPETFSAIYITRPPSIFQSVWKIARMFIAERTRSKIRVLGSTAESLKPLHQAVAKELLPPFLGGTNTCDFPPAGRLK
jgi:hypothetical protein